MQNNTNKMTIKAKVTSLDNSKSNIEDEDCNFLSYKASQPSEEPFFMNKNTMYVNTIDDENEENLKE